ASALERINLAIPIHKKIVIINEKVQIEYVGTIATNTITIIKNGNTKKKSTTRIKILSICPPKYPATIPVAIPIKPDIKVTNIQIDNEFLVPIISWPNTSLPP